MASQPFRIGAVGDKVDYVPGWSPFGSSGGTTGSAQFSTGITRAKKKAQLRRTGAGGEGLPGAGGFRAGVGPGGAGGAGGAGAGAFDPLSITVAPSPEMQQATAEYQKRLSTLEGAAKAPDENLQYQIDQYKQRMGEGPTTRSIERAASAIRDQMAGMSGAAEAAGAAGGRGPGLGAAGIGEAGQRALAGAAADISLGREGQLDQLLLGGQNIMAAPGQQALNYNALANQLYGMNPYAQAANLGLAEKGLGLEAYLGQGQLANDAARIQMQQQMQPWEILQLLGGL